MTKTLLPDKAKQYLEYLSLELPTRSVGTPGNRAATTFFAETVSSFGFQTETPEFDCIDWRQAGATLTSGTDQFTVHPSPYTLGCQAHAPLAVVSTVAELEAADVAGMILLLRGAIAKEQLMPKNFPFYNPDEHKHIIHLLETKAPQAIIAATTRDPQMVGAMYPFPLFEDGDFDIPSVFLTDIEGDRLAAHAGELASLDIRARRLPAKGCNVIARKGAQLDRKVVITAHIDSRLGTPGALDNASGTVTLLLLAELLQDYEGKLGIELVAINGEDYYANPGEIQYINLNQGRFDQIRLNMNIDDVGYLDGKSAYSLYECPAELAELIRKSFSAQSGLMEGENWYQGDHMIFVLNQVPALALTSEKAMQNLATITHTPQDRPELVDYPKLVELAQALRQLLRDMDQQLSI
jgi:aminopeptidase YwaD